MILSIGEQHGYANTAESIDFFTSNMVEIRGSTITATHEGYAVTSNSGQWKRRWMYCGKGKEAGAAVELQSR